MAAGARLECWGQVMGKAGERARAEGSGEVKREAVDGVRAAGLGGVKWGRRKGSVAGAEG